MAGGGEAGDVADLGDDQQRGVAADAADLAEHVDAVVFVGALLDLAGRVGDLAMEVEVGAIRLSSRRLARRAARELAAALTPRPAAGGWRLPRRGYSARSPAREPGSERLAECSIHREGATHATYAATPLTRSSTQRTNETELRRQAIAKAEA